MALLAHAVATHRVATAVGGSPSGKTETIKVRKLMACLWFTRAPLQTVAHALGRFMVIFSCTPMNSLPAISSVFSGLAQVCYGPSESFLCKLG